MTCAILGNVSLKYPIDEPVPFSALLGEDDRQRVLGFHSIADGPSVRISSGSLLALPGRVASTHELIHQSLTESTSFGYLMIICSLLMRSEADLTPYDVHLRRLASQCRTTHESLATFESIWMVGDGDIRLLYGSREYFNWYKDAHDAIPLPDHTRLKLIALRALTEVCMCPPVLDRLLELGTSSSDVWYIPPQDRPDRRFGLIFNKAGKKFWFNTWAECRAMMDADIWNLFMAKKASSDSLTETFQEPYDELVVALADHIRERVSDLLNEHGVRTALVTDDVVERLSGFVEGIPSIRGLIGTGSESFDENMLRDLFRERILLSEEPRSAHLTAFNSNEQLLPVWKDNNDEDLRPFMYIIIRSAKRLLEQFTFAIDRQDYLRKCGNTLFTLIVTLSDDGVWQLLYVRDPSELTVLREMLDGQVEMHVSYSMTSMALARRADKTTENVGLKTASQAIMLADYRTAILDFPITAAIRGWVEQGMQFKYSSGVVRVSGQERLHVVAVCPESGDIVILVLCGFIQEQKLVSFLQSECSGATQDDSLFTPHSGKRKALRIVEVLLNSEHVIDFKAVPRSGGN